MRRLFIESDTRLWVNPTRSARMQGMITSIRLKFSFWEILADLCRLASLGYKSLDLSNC